MSSFSINEEAVKTRTATIKNNINNINDNMAQVLNKLVEIINNGYWSGSKANRFYQSISTQLISSNNNITISKIIEKSNNMCKFLDTLLSETSKVEKEVSKKVNESSTKNTTTPNASSNTDKITGKTITIQKGDTLWNLAVKNGYKGSQWQEIFRDANGNKITNDQATKFRTGDKIILVGLNASAADVQKANNATKVDTSKVKANNSSTPNTIPKSNNSSIIAYKKNGRTYYDTAKAGQHPKGVLTEAEQDIIYDCAKAHGIDPAIVFAIIDNESRFVKDAINTDFGPSDYHWGLMQISSKYGGAYGVNSSNWKDVYSNVNAGCAMLEYWLKYYKGDYAKAISAYSNGYLAKGVTRTNYSDRTLNKARTKYGYTG